ncbi:unnamed protein product [Lymnaea stagnalis]|uniref:Uncharacterized protein n=1 Tax=Lymnaea stagnalis TaxID=6523 RepID=A0AAV2H1S1_LYMST
MGRRAGTNSSPVDSAMARYYNDVGSRLSGVFMPTSEAEKTLSDDFCMLTLDTRSWNRVRNSRAGTSAMTNCAHKSQMNSSNRSLRSTTSSGVSSLSSSHSGNEKTPKGKMRLVDKLTRALFQKKHMCSRCNKRSRTCLPNKTFTHTEKHYTCASCREQTQAVRTLFKQHDRATTSTLPPSDSVSAVPTQQNQERTEPQTRTHNTDSGYDTATSCSTLASAYSAFNSPVNTVKSTAGVRKVKDDLVWERTSQNGDDENSTTQMNHREPVQDAHAGRSPQLSGELYQLLGVGHSQTSGVLRQVRPRLVHNYDGYLPEVDFENFEKCDVRSALPDAGTFEGRTVDGTACDLTANDGRVGSSLGCKVCHICGSAEKPSFRLPLVGGWLCEDCLDVVH